MGLESGKPRQLLHVARVETDYLDSMGRPTNPEAATRVITREFDADGNLIVAKLSIDYTKLTEST